MEEGEEEEEEEEVEEKEEEELKITSGYIDLLIPESHLPPPRYAK